MRERERVSECVRACVCACAAMAISVGAKLQGSTKAMRVRRGVSVGKCECVEQVQRWW